MSVSTPWLSVIMPVHHGAADLPATLESMTAQTMDGVEIILLDSSDDSSCARIVEGFSDRLPISYHPRSDVKPWPDKTNIGVEMARAPHIVMLHQDDLWLTDHIAAVRRATTMMDDATICIAPAHLVNDLGQTIGCWSPPLTTGFHSGATVAEKLLVQNFIAISTPIIRRTAWLEVGGMDGKLWYTADWDLYLKLAQSGRVMVETMATTAFRIHGRSLTMTGSRDAAAMRAQHDIVLERHGGGARRSTMRLAHASATINCALAAAATGDKSAIVRVLGQMCRLGPIDLIRYLRNSRLIERLLPRIRLRLAGAL